ncbi:MAG: hypothetical protein ACRD2J_13975 [Thermoanaerobaculia bacterium]
MYPTTLILAAILLALAACAREEVPTTPSATEVSGTTAIQDVNPITAQSWLDGFALGSEVGPEGTIAEGAAKNEFAPGDPIHVTMEVGDAPPASAVKVVWIGPGDAPVGDEIRNVAGGQEQMHFQAPDTTAWPAGAYRVEVWVADENVSTQQFRIIQGE